jgi:hypothetical protein
MNFLVELFAELFGWVGLGQAVKDFEQGDRKRVGIKRKDLHVLKRSNNNNA